MASNFISDETDLCANLDEALINEKYVMNTFIKQFLKKICIKVYLTDFWSVCCQFLVDLKSLKGVLASCFNPLLLQPEQFGGRG